MQLGDRPGPVLAGPGRTAADAAFEAFYARHVVELARLAFLVTGDGSVADEVAADALLATWRQWDRVSTADSPIAYVRKIVVNIGATRVRRRIVERGLLNRLAPLGDVQTREVDLVGGVDVRRALQALPPRRRACLVLRYAFDLSEAEVAETLGISVGTVKSQTSKAAAQLRALLAPSTPARRHRA